MMHAHGRTIHVHRRGITMLIVLLAVVALTSGVVALARDAASLSQAARVGIDARAADDLLLAAETPILHWLGGFSQSTVLPPDAAEPHVPILHDRFQLGARHATVRIDAFDACGPSRLNISTAPMADVEHALAHVGSGHMDIIRKARSEHRVPPLPGATHADSSRTPDAPRVTLVNISPRWRFIVRVRCGEVTRTCSLIYVSASEQWLVEERRFLDE